MKNIVLVAIVFCLFVATRVSSQIITTFAGTGSSTFSGDGSSATLAGTPLPFGGAFDANGNYYFVECAGAPRIRKITSDGIITTVAGDGTYGYAGDGGLATAAEIKNSFFDVDAADNIYIADNNNYRVRKVDVTTGIITTIAGNGTPTSTGDGGPASAATLDPIDIVLDNHGNIYIGENGGNIRKIDRRGVISSIVIGLGYGGMAIGNNGSLYAGCNTYIIRVDTASFNVDTIAGTGIATYNGDDIPATAANIKVYDLAVDRIGNIYISTYIQNRIRKIDTFGIIHTIAGDGSPGFSGDTGPATNAQINTDEGVAVDVCGNVYVADLGNNRVRKITQPPIIITPTIMLTGSSAVAVGTTVTVDALVGSAGSSYIIYWMDDGVVFTTTTVPYVTYTKAAGTDTITARIVPTGYGCWDSTTSAPHIVGVSSEDLSPALSEGEGAIVYPNPAQGSVQVISNTNISELIVTNIPGQMVREKRCATTHEQMDVSGLSPGLYLLRIIDEYGTVHVVKLMVDE